MKRILIALTIVLSSCSGIYTCRQYENKFEPFYSAPWPFRVIEYDWTPDSGLIYSLSDLNEKTGKQWGAKLFYIGELQPHYNGLNWGLSHLDKLQLSVYYYRDSVLYAPARFEVKPGVTQRLKIDASGGMVRWYINDAEVYRIDNWAPKIYWLHTPWYGTSGSDPYKDGTVKPRACAPHKMSMKVKFRSVFTNTKL